MPPHTAPPHTAGVPPPPSRNVDAPEEDGTHVRRAVKRQRYELLRHVNRATEKPLVALSFVWLGLLVLDLTRGLSRTLEVVHYVIWGLFVADFVVEFVIAPGKQAYLRRNVLTVVALVLPAVRVLSVLRVLRYARVLRLARAARGVRAVRGVRLVRVLTGINRGLRASAAWLGRRGAGYVAAATILVTFAGAAGMWAFENPRALRDAGHAAAADAGAGLDGYGEAVWWTAMLMTTMGSEYWPTTVEGRVLCFLLAVYAFAVFGYVAATIASYFVAQDKAADDLTPADVAALREEIAALRAQLRASRDAPGAERHG